MWLEHYTDQKAWARAARTDRGTCAPLPFHITGGQPTMGQGVVIHTGERDLLQYVQW
ncbi:unnamed protein product [Spirodela intermedia]|uniref:Uncharacterized protein n=1 Tax=Spirodela intermedia TaxID=51605 RepID=A0A7I8JRJ0_SPIIN|nr:unnamed protein product [Spirodela intermedia]CAA6672786.1 unnamed protein product [Spirodela intermedia]